MHTPETDIALIRRVLAVIAARPDAAHFAPITELAARTIELLAAGPLSDQHVAELATALRSIVLSHADRFGRRAARALFDVVCAAAEATDRVAALEAGVGVRDEHVSKVTESAGHGESAR